MKSILPLLVRNNTAAVGLRNVRDKDLKKMLAALSVAIGQGAPLLLRANERDLAAQQPGDFKRDRLLLDASRVQAIARSVKQISRLPNPAGKILLDQQLDNGLRLQKLAVPLGTVGAIYESRPNVTFDIAALCLRSQNACVLKGSIEAKHSNYAAVKIIHGVLEQFGIDKAAVTLLPPDRAVVDQLFTATKYIDVLIPRGSDSLIRYVREHSRVPVIETGAGVCHVYVQGEADLEKAVKIVVNAKVSRPSVCNALDTIIVDRSIARAFLKKLQPAMQAYKVIMFADPQAAPLLKGYPFLEKARTTDFAREFLSLQCAVKVVSGFDEAMEHIRKYSTRHSEAIVSQNRELCRRFLHEVDAAAVYSNASTRFTDGEQFRLGAEIGISTQKLHARGPFALEKLVTEKWVITGNGQIRE